MSDRATWQERGFCGAVAEHEARDWHCNRPIDHTGEHSACIDSIEWDDDETEVGSLPS